MWTESSWALSESYTADDSWIVRSSDGGQQGDKRAHISTTKRFIYDFRLLKGDVKVEGEGKDEGAIGAVESGQARRPVPGQLPHTPSQVIVYSSWRPHPPPSLNDFLQLDPGKEIPENPQLLQLARERLKFIFSQSAYFFEAPNFTSPTNKSFPDILIDLSRYDSNELVQGSMHLLNRFYSAEVTLFQKAIQTQLLVTEESQRVFTEIKELLPPLRRLLSVDAGESQRKEIIRIINTFTQMCVLQQDDEEPHQQNQKILYNYGVLSDVLNYVLLHAKGTADIGGGEEGDEGSGEAVKSKGLETGFSHSNEAVFVACFRFLKALAKDNIQVQRRLYDRMDDLLDVDLAVPYIADVLTEVFTGGPELCMKVREEQVEKLFQMVASVGEEEGRAELIMTLQAIAKVEDIDLPVKRNQEFIIKFFSKTRERFCDHLLGEGMKKDRWELLTQDRETSELRLLLAMTDLLASCSEGKNLFIESVCQTVYTVDELLMILKEPKLPPERKRPFSRFLVWVYMNTGRDTFQSGASEIAMSKVMWDYFEHIAFLLSNIGNVLRVMPHSEMKLVRQSFSSASRKYPASDRQCRSKAPLTRSKSIPFVTGDDGKLLPGLLLYFSDGILPLLKSFYAVFFDPSAGMFDRDRRLRISSDILTALLHLSDSLMKYFTMDSQVKLYRGTVLTIMNSGRGEIPLQVEEQVFETFNFQTLHCSGIVSAAREDYKDKYSAEINLNDEFNKFTSNYRLAYQGPNTARAQIGARFDTKYSDLDKELKQPGDEYLPLGPSFQEHVACFAKPRTFTVGHQRVKPEAERLIKQLEISFGQLEEMEEKDRQRQVELDIKSLQILRAIIHNEIMHIDPNLKEENPASFRKRCDSRVQPVQNAIQDFDNAVSRVIPLLSHPNDEIVREVLAFLKTIMFSGNRHVQEGMAHLLSTREERLFTTMQDLFTHAAITHRERQTLLAQMESRLATEKMLADSFKSIQGTGGHQVPRPVPAVAVNIEVEDVKGAEFIPLETITCSPPQEESSLYTTQSRLPIEPQESSPLLPSLHLPTSTSKQKEKPQRRRASSKPAMGTLDSRSGSLVRDTIARRSTSQQDKGQGKDFDAAVVELLSFKDSSHVKLALQVLGLMCDGQYRVMQNYLREQRDNIHTTNLVGDVALFIQHFYYDVSVETVELVHLILQTLIEMCVGNYPNQAVIFNRQIVEVLNSIFRIDIGETHGGYTVEDSVNLKASAVELLEVMLEETSEKSSELVMEIAGSLDIDALHDTLADFYELMNDPKVKGMGFDDEAERGLFRTYHILVHLRDYAIPSSIKEQTEPVKEASTETLTAWNAWEFCNSRSRSVEVFYRNMDGDKILTRVHFQFDPENKFREDLVERVKWNVNRDSPEDKLRDFMDWMKAVKKETLHHTWLQKKWLLRPLISFPQSRYYILIFLSLLMNLFLLINFEVPSNLRQTDDTNVTFEEAMGAFQPGFQNWFTVVLYLFGAIHLFFSLWMLIEYFLINWKNFVLPRFFYIPIARWHPPPEETYSDVNIFGLQTVYVMLFVMASILSLAFWGYFYCFCLLHIIVNNDILQRVLRSITRNGISLLWVAILGLVVLYIYSVVSFAFLHESFLKEDNDDADLFCNTLFECLISVLRYGLIDNLGLVVPLVPEEWRTAGLRLLYDISFFIIVTTIGLNIVFGIIVDTFSELRDERYHIEQDKKTFCFICSLPSHEFERKAKGFDHHVEKDHNMWNYIYFSMYLDQIDTSDHNAIESFVYKMIRSEKLDYFPLLVALTLGKEEDETARHLEELKTMVRDVLDHFKAEEHKTTLRDKLQEQAKWEELNLGEGSDPPHKEAPVEDSSQ